MVYGCVREYHVRATLHRNKKYNDTEYKKQTLEIMSLHHLFTAVNPKLSQVILSFHHYMHNQT